MKNKNLIIICIDGGRLDRVSKSKIFNEFSTKGIFFPQTITYAPYTNSAIHALISGAYGNRNGCYSYWHSMKFKNNEFKTLTEYLHENGYYTYADIPSDLVIPNLGFDEFQVYDESLVDLKDRHKNIIEKMKTKNDNGESFFLYLHYESIHTGILNSILKGYNNFSKEYFENRELNEERYDKLFSIAEKYVLELTNKFSEYGFWENSIILITADHGISVGEKFGERAYGAFCYDYTIKTFAYYLNSNLETKKINQQIRHVDFLPTILDDIGIPLDKNFRDLDGVSLIPLINGKLLDEKIAYTETGNPLDSNEPPKKPNVKSVRTSKWKLIYNEHNDTKELYDLEKDPNENKNLIGTGLEIENTLWEKLVQIMNTRN